MYGYLNLLSLLLGLAAWGFPLIFLARYPHLHLGRTLVASSLCCAGALWCQMAYSDHLVAIEDWSALLDTSGAVVRAAAVLVIITLLLQLVSVALAGASRERTL